MGLETIRAVWDLSPLNGDFEKKRAEWERAADVFAKTWREREDYCHDPEILFKALDDYEKFMRFFGYEADERYYFWLRHQQDLTDSQIKARFNQVDTVRKDIENRIRFFTHRLSCIPKDVQTSLLESESLQLYRHFLTRIFAHAEYLLSEPEENIMSMKSTSAYSSWVAMVSEFLAREERVVLDEEGKEKSTSFSNIISLLNSTHKNVRDRAAEAFNDILVKNALVAEAELNAILLDKKVNDELRGYPRPDSARHVSDDIPSSIVDALVESVYEKRTLAHRFYTLKAKLLNTPVLAYHERNVPIGTKEKTYTYEESARLIYDVFSHLDEQFAATLKRFLENGQIDAFPRKGKRQGAFCVHFLKTQPTYVLLNHTNTIRDVTTFAHEMGHAINNELAKEKQHALYFDTSLATAEVASTFMEDFVLQELLKDADDEMRLALMVEKLQDDINSIIRQIACYRFERALHSAFRREGYLSYTTIGKLFQEHMATYMGSAVEQSEGSENWWIYWSHVRSYFYNYSYASGLLISKALQRMVRANPSFIENVKKFLSTGTSQSPKDIFLEMGIDISQKRFWEQGLQEVEDLLDDAEVLAKKLGKI